MAKLKNIIKQLTQPDFEAIFQSLMGAGAEKSAYLLKFMRERQMSDAKIMDELGVNTNAYYTLRSRLNQKIEEYLLQQMENPRMDLMKKVANVSDVVFTKKRAISVTTLKKLESELEYFDLPNELITVYKYLKVLHTNHPSYFDYSQKYNRYVAYTLALHKAEDLVAEYFKRVGLFMLTGRDMDKIGLQVIYEELVNVANLYESHRLYVFMSLVAIWHKLYIAPDIELKDSIEDMLASVEETMDKYIPDTTYYHIRVVFEYLSFAYYYSTKSYRKAEKYYESINESTSLLVSNYGQYTFPSQLLVLRLDRAYRNEESQNLYEENKVIFADFELDENDLAKVVYFQTYRALGCLHANKPEEAARILQNTLNHTSFKSHQEALAEIKALLLYCYRLMNDEDLMAQVSNSLARQIRQLGEEHLEHLTQFIKVIKASVTEARSSKLSKLQSLLAKVNMDQVKHFSPIRAIPLDDSLVVKLMG